MSDPWIIAAVTVGLIAASAFFVAAEFALIAARRNRLEDAAVTSRAARAALRSTTELSVLLAGCQLGITVCTLALGAVTKPAVHYALTPLLRDWGAPGWLADVVGFVLALVIVTFLHLVIGEMAPKSWAIAHPERSATLLALPMRAFIWLTRPLLASLNAAANWLLRRVSVTPVDEVAAGQDPAALRHLVEYSATAGTLDERYRAYLTSALELEAVTVGDIVTERTDVTEIPADAGTAAIRAQSRASGHRRLLVRDTDRFVGVVHVRDSLDRDATAAELMRPVLRLPSDMPVYEALRRMRETRNHLALVVRADGAGDVVTGLVTLTDMLHRLLPPVAAAH